MKIKKIELKNFKRFTNLVITDVPDTSKLVLLIGSNGSGKSSLFDAFDWLSKGFSKGMPYSGEDGENYYRKNKKSEPYVSIIFSDDNVIEKEGMQVKAGKELISKFFGRSSIRIVPRISNHSDTSSVLNDKDSPTTYIEHDTRFTNDVSLYIQNINKALQEPVFKGEQADILKIFRDFIEPLNQSLLKIFGGNESTTIQIAEFKESTSTSTAKLIFTKGESKINYDLLSHGEKQVVILLINFIVRQQYYEDAIIYIDEMDSHLNTALQSSLLEEIVTRWIPANTQLWTASHALGFIDYAKKSENATIIDFDLLNFDTRKELVPLPKDHLDMYEIAIPKATIASILKGYKLVIVENKNDEQYNLSLGEEGYLFLPANNNREVFLTVKQDKDKLGLRDRDYLRTDEIKKIKEKCPNLKILELYTFENYIYHPENIEELGLKGFNKQEYEHALIKEKNEHLLEIVSEIRTSRTHYIEFKDCIKNDDNIRPIMDKLESDNIEDFYPFFNVKKHFSKKYLQSFQYSFNDLCRTKWFKKAILQVLNA